MEKDLPDLQRWCVYPPAVGHPDLAESVRRGGRRVRQGPKRLIYRLLAPTLSKPPPNSDEWGAVHEGSGWLRTRCCPP